MGVGGSMGLRGGRLVDCLFAGGRGGGGGLSWTEGKGVGCFLLLARVISESLSECMVIIYIQVSLCVEKASLTAGSKPQYAFDRQGR